MKYVFDTPKQEMNLVPLSVLKSLDNGVEQGYELKRKLNNAFSTTFSVSMNGIPLTRERTVDVSHILYDEETVVAVFRNGKNSVTRHFQPPRFLGVGKKGISNSSIYQTHATRCNLDFLGDFMFDFIKDGTIPSARFS